MSGLKVPTFDPDHDAKVGFAIHEAQALCEERDLDAGIGVLEYSDVTVVVITEKVPRREVFVTDQTDQTDPHPEVAQ